MSDVESIDIDVEVKPKKNLQQLENLRKGREKRMQNIAMKKRQAEEEEKKNKKKQKKRPPPLNIKPIRKPVEKINVEDSDEDVVEVFQETKPRERTPVSHYIAFDEMVDRWSKQKEEEKKKREEDDNKINYSELESFVNECIDKYFERSRNMINLTQQQPTPPQQGDEGVLGSIKKMSPFLVAFLCAKYPHMVGNILDLFMNSVQQPSAIETRTEINEQTMEERIEEAGKNDPRESGTGSVPIPKEKWKSQLNIGEENTDNLKSDAQ